MKHIQLFEQLYRPSWLPPEPKPDGKILIGYFNDGGIGSHPAIIEAGILPEIDKREKWNSFDTTESTDVMPEALLAIYSDAPNTPSFDGWYIKGISNSLAREIIKLGDSDVYRCDDKDLFSRKAFDLAGYPYGDPRSDVQILTVIPNVSLNKVYWSDNPEDSHGYWEPPYKEISIESLI